MPGFGGTVVDLPGIATALPVIMSTGARWLGNVNQAIATPAIAVALGVLMATCRKCRSEAVGKGSDGRDYCAYCIKYAPK